MALSLCRTTVDDSARELLEHGTAAFPIASVFGEIVPRFCGISACIFRNLMI